MIIQRPASSLNPFISRLNRQEGRGPVVAHATLEAQRKGERGAEIFGAARALGKPILINRFR